MNKDIRLSVSFFHHPKTIKLQSLLGSEGVLSLLRLWCYAGNWKPSGDLSGMNDEEIECAALFVGSPGLFVKTMLETRFMDENRTLHDWEEHNPYAFHATIRSIKARISAHLKHGDTKSANALRKLHNLPAKRIRNAVPSQKNRTAPSPIPIPIPSPDPVPLEPLSGKPDDSSKEMPYQEIVEDLNNKSCTVFKHTSSKTRRLIDHRINEGFSVVDFKAVHDHQAARWLKDPEMKRYLRPETLYGTKFESYLNHKPEDEHGLQEKSRGGPGGNGSGAKSFHQRDVEEAERVKQAVRTRLGFPGRSVGLGNQPDQGEDDGRRKDAGALKVIDVPKAENYDDK